MQGTIPVYRYYNNFDHDHVYTTNYRKWGKGGSYRTPDGEHGYTYEVGRSLCCMSVMDSKPFNHYVLLA
jgi:hypothetical protein